MWNWKTKNVDTRPFFLLHYYVCYTEKKKQFDHCFIGPTETHNDTTQSPYKPMPWSDFPSWILPLKFGLFLPQKKKRFIYLEIWFIYLYFFFITKPTLNFILLKNAMSIYKNTTCTMMCVEILHLDLIKIVMKPFSFIRYLSLVKEIKYGCLTLNFQA